MSEHQKTNGSPVNSSERRAELRKAWADSLHELRRAIADAESLFRQTFENPSQSFSSVSLAR